jgi:hypothetical protein
VAEYLHRRREATADEKQSRWGNARNNGGDSAISNALESAQWFSLLTAGSLLLLVPFLLYMVIAPILLPCVEDVVYSFD